MDKIINMKIHILSIELATRTHSYFISSIECDTFIQMCQVCVLFKYVKQHTMLSTDAKCTRSHIATTKQKHLISKIRINDH